jgi:PKD repeat protein
MLVIDEEQRAVHVFATGPQAPNYSCSTSGGAIYEKTSPLDAISFADGYGTVVIQDADSPVSHNASSTKQNVNAATGIVVLAVNTATSRYWHHYDPLSPPGPPTASFSATPTSGPAPLSVAFTDTSTGSPTSWSWTFGDGTSSSERTATHTYAAAGTYTVSLTVSNASGTDTETKVDYITVMPPEPDFSVSAAPSSATVVRGTSTRYDVSIMPTNGFSGLVDLSVSGLPSGAAASFSKDPVEVPSSTTSALTVTTSSTTKLGTFTLTITGASGTLTRTATVSLRVKKR